MVLLGFVETSEVRSVSASMQPGPSARAGTGSSSSGRGVCQKIHAVSITFTYWGGNHGKEGCSSYLIILKQARRKAEVRA